MDFHKIQSVCKAVLVRAAAAAARTVKRIYLWGKKWTDKLFDRFPIQDKYKRALSMSTLSLILVAVVLVSIPVAQNVGETVGDVVGNLVGTTGSETAQSVANVVSTPVLDEVLPETMSTPSNDFITIPTGSASWQFEQDEVYRLQRIMVYLERCDNFDYNSANKDSDMALTAFRYMIETGSMDLRASDNGTQYATSDTMINKYVNGLFGRNLTAGSDLGSIADVGGYYIYNEANPGPSTATGYMTEAYSLGNNFYKITGIVTRGFPSETGKYSKKLSVVLVKNSAALYGYYVISLSIEPVSYTYIDTLSDFYVDPGDEDETDDEYTAASSTVSHTTVGGESSSDSASSVTSDTSAASVTLPQVTDETQKATLSSQDKSNLQKLLDAVPDLIVDFDASKESSMSNLTLLSHLMLCADQHTDYASGATSNIYADINTKALAVFGTKITTVTNEKSTYSLDPYIISGKTEFELEQAYDLGNNRYLLVCTASHFSNALLSEADIIYTYTAVVEKSDAALYGFYLKGQTFVKQ